jgi:PAS domain S-box-containing protein
MSSAALPLAENQDGRQVLQRQFWLLLAGIIFGIAAALMPIDAGPVPLEQFVLLHTVLEFCSVLVAFLVFGTVWFTPSKQVSSSQILISAALFSAAILNFMHMMSIHGMPAFVTVNTTQKTIAFGLASRAAVGAAILMASFIPKSTLVTAQTRRLITLFFTAYTAAFTVLILFYPDVMPDLFIPGSGTTQAKLVVELVLFGVFSFTAFRYYQLARSLTESYDALIFGAMALTAVEELFFAHYKIGTDAQNLLGHVYKLVSYWLLFKAMFILSIRKPYELLGAQAEKLMTINESFRIQTLALESTETPVLMTDLSGQVTWQNRASLTLKRPSLTGGITLFDPAFTPDQSVATQMKEQLAQGQSWRGQISIRHNNEETIYLDRIVTPVRSESGSVVGYVSVSENITQNVLTKARHRRVLETALDGYWVMDNKFRIIEINEAFSNMTGYSGAELLTMRVHDLKPAEDLHRVERHTQKIKEDGYARFYTNYVKKNGDLLPVDVAITYDEQSDQFYLFVRDCTEQERSNVTR